MNKVLIVGYTCSGTSLIPVEGKGNKCEFRVVVLNDSGYDSDSRTYTIKCFAYEKIANFIWRNCNTKGILVEIIGHIEKNNAVYVEQIKCLTKREIVLGNLDEYIKTYSDAMVKNEVKKKKKKEEQ